MTSFQKLKHEARRAEQRSNWAQAIELYQRALDADEDMADLSLYNRIGDLHLRLGQTDEAVACYERAVERYAENGMHTSAIALCNKILRIAPGHGSAYRRLGVLHGRTGLVAEGRTNCLEFARRAIEGGRVEEAVEAADEFADATGDEEVRRRVRELLEEHGESAAAERVRSADDDASEPVDGGTPSGPVRLAHLVADRLEGSDPQTTFDPERPRTEETGAPAPDDGLSSVRRTLGRFRAALEDMLDDGELSVRYDLGVEFMTIGLLDEAIEEFQAAVVDPSLVEAANARIGECLALRTSGAGFERIHPASRSSQARPASEPESGVSPEPEAATQPKTAIRPASGTPSRPEAEPDSDTAADPDAEAGDDELEGHFFRARLAQYRVRRAEERHMVDHAAHLDLGTAYVEMELHEEALRELGVALDGPRTVVRRAARALKRLALGASTSPELALDILERLSDARPGAVADTLGGELAEAWGPDHLHADRLRELRGRLSEALEELPALEDMFPALDEEESAEVAARDGGTVARGETNDALVDEATIDDAETDGEVTPAPESGGPPDVAVSSSDGSLQDPDSVLRQADALANAGETGRAAELLRDALERLESQKRTRDGLAVLGLLLELTPDDVELHERRAEMALMANDREAVLEAHAALAACLERDERFSAARAAYGRMLDVDPSNETARTAIRRIDERELQAEREAIRSRAEEADGGLSEAQAADLAEVEALLSDLDAETGEAQFVRGGDPESTEVESDDDPAARSRYELGLAFRQMGMWEEAARELRPALGGVADRLAVLEALGECLVKAGRGEDAVTLLRENLRADEDAEQVGPLYFFGLALAATGDEAEARKVLARVDAARPGYRDVQARLSELSI